MLTLIDGAGGEAEFGLIPQTTDKGWTRRTVIRSLPQRPGDLTEAWTFADGTILEPIRRAARNRGLSPDLSVALVVERRLVLEELRTSGLAELETVLNRRSTEARPTMELWSAHNAYLENLLRGDDLERASNLPLRSPRVALPIRLVDRLGAFSPFDEVPPREEELERAIEWEVAALRGGVLMGEWAYRCALAEMTSRASDLAAFSC